MGNRWEVFRRPKPLPQADRYGLIGGTSAEIYFEIFNEQGTTPLLFLHPGMGSIVDWGNQIQHFSRNHCVIALDTRGHGASPLPLSGLSYELLRDDVYIALPKLIKSKITVVGWSDGAITGLKLASRHPDLVRGIFAFAPHMNQSGRRQPPLYNKALPQILEFTESSYRSRAPNPDAWTEFGRQYEAMASVDLKISAQELKNINAPVLISHAEHDEIIVEEHAQLVARSIQNAKFKLLKDVSHGAPTQDAMTFNHEIEVFLKGLE